MSAIGFSSVSLDRRATGFGRDDFRHMVDAVRGGDLAQARRAYDRVIGRNGAASGGPLAALGAALGAGDLAAANGALDGLEQKALNVLRRVRDGGDPAPRTEAPRDGATFRFSV